MGRISSVGFLALILFTKQTTLKRRPVVLSFSLQLVFPANAYHRWLFLKLKIEIFVLSAETSSPRLLSVHFERKRQESLNLSVYSMKQLQLSVKNGVAYCCFVVRENI
jgi:hypothetical protein